MNFAPLVWLSDFVNAYIFYRCFNSDTFPQLVVSADRRAEHCNNFGIDHSDAPTIMSKCCSDTDFCNELITLERTGILLFHSNALFYMANTITDSFI